MGEGGWVGACLYGEVRLLEVVEVERIDDGRGGREEEDVGSGMVEARRETRGTVGVGEVPCAVLSAALAAFLALMSANTCSLVRPIVASGDNGSGEVESSAFGDMVGGEAVMGPSAKDALALSNTLEGSAGRG